MRLTQKQETLVSRYLRDVAVQIDYSVSPQVREEALESIQAQIQRDLAALNKDLIDDVDVQNVLRKAGSPAQRAAEIMQAHDTEGSLTGTWNKRVWLGVCQNLAQRMETTPGRIRAAFVVAGLLTGPLALIVYLGLFFQMYYAEAPEHRPEVETVAIFKNVVIVLAVGIALYIGTNYLLELAVVLWDRQGRGPFPALGDLGWLLVYNDSLFFWTLAIALPLSVLAALPLADKWDQSLWRVSQALLALYGIALAAGIGCLMAGLILSFIKTM